MAALSQNFIERGDAITFDTVLTNQNEVQPNQPAYDQETGSFNAPVDGTYVFHVNVLLRFLKFLSYKKSLSNFSYSEYYIRVFFQKPNDSDAKTLGHFLST